jgi:hypothetical protein
LFLQGSKKKDKAIEHYEKFLGLWKDADLGIAEVEDKRERGYGEFEAWGWGEWIVTFSYYF